MQINQTVTTTARRAQIVRAAVDTIAELGYAKASFAKITERAGLSSPRMISYHFADKQDLINQLVTEVFTAAAEYIRERIEAADTARGKLSAYLEANLDYLREHPREMAALTECGSALRTAEGKPHTSASVQEPSVLGLEPLLRKGQRTGEFRAFDVRSMAVLIRGAVDAAAQRISGEPGFDVEGYREELITSVELATRKESR